MCGENIIHAMRGIWFLLVFSMLCVAHFDVLPEFLESDFSQIENFNIPTTAEIIDLNIELNSKRGKRLIRAAATAKPKGKSVKSSNSKRVKLNKLTQKYWRSLLDCCDPPELLTRVSRTQCYPKYKNFKGQVTVGPIRFPKSEPFNRTCLVECAFKKENMIDKSNGLLSIPGIDRKVRVMIAQNPKWTKAITSSYASCNAVYTSLINKELTCHSGAAEWAQCLVKYMVANCPPEVQPKKAAGCFERLATLRELMKVKAAAVDATTKAATTAAATTAATDATTAAAAATNGSAAA